MQIRKKMVFFHLFVYFFLQELLGMEIEDEQNIIKTPHQVMKDIERCYKEYLMEVKESQKIYLNNHGLRGEQLQYLENKRWLTTKESAQLFKLQDDKSVYIDGIRTEELLSVLKDTLNVITNERQALDKLDDDIRKIPQGEYWHIQDLLLYPFQFNNYSQLKIAKDKLQSRISALELMIYRLSYRKSAADQKIKIKHYTMIENLRKDAAYRIQPNTENANIKAAKEMMCELFPE